MEQYRPDVLISEEEISLRIDALAKAINEEFEGQELVVVCVLKGAFMFCSDLIKKIQLPVKLEFIQLSSYGEGTTSSGNVKIEMDLSGSIKDKNVIIVEDIIDSGKTLKFLLKEIENYNLKSLSIVTLLKKNSINKINKEAIDWYGFEINDKYVIGYGLDINNLFRELKDIYIKDE